jgi:hypothetical protein
MIINALIAQYNNWRESMNVNEQAQEAIKMIDAQISELLSIKDDFKKKDSVPQMVLKKWNSGKSVL